MAVLIATISTGAAAQQISIPGNEGTSATGHAAGETFVTPTGFDILDSFSFWVFRSSGYRGFIYEWNTSTNRAKGSALYTSGDVSTPSSSPTEVTFNVGSLVLDPAKTYVAFIRSDVATSNLTLEFDSHGIATDPYTHGQYVTGPAAPTNPTTSAWGLGGSQTDAEFAATFSAPVVNATPEPATLVLFATGMAGVGFVSRRRARSRTDRDSVRG